MSGREITMPRTIKKADAHKELALSSKVMFNAPNAATSGTTTHVSMPRRSTLKRGSMSTSATTFALTSTRRCGHTRAALLTRSAPRRCLIGQWHRPERRGPCSCSSVCASAICAGRDWKAIAYPGSCRRATRARPGGLIANADCRCGTQTTPFTDPITNIDLPFCFNLPCFISFGFQPWGSGKCSVSNNMQIRFKQSFSVH